MKRLIAIVAMIGLLLTSVCLAEGVPFSEWIAGKEPVVVEDISAEEAYAAEAPAFSPIGVGSRGDSVVQLQTKLIELGILNGKADGVFGPATEAALKAAQKALGWEETGSIQTADEMNAILAIVPGDGINILLDTNKGTENYRLIDNGFNATLEQDGDGVKVHNASRDDTGWLVLFYDDGRSRELLSGPEGEQYTLSFEAKSNIDGAEIRAFHRQGNAAENQITFGTVILGKHDEWAKYVLRGTLTGVEAKAQGLYFDLRYSNPPDTEIYIRNVKIEKGSFATEWSASPEEVSFQIGMQSEYIYQLQNKLNELGFYSGLADGIFDYNTQESLKEAQIKAGLDPIGDFGSYREYAAFLSLEEGDGVNILLDTNKGTENYRLIDKGFNATLEQDGDGVKVHNATRDDTGWLVLFYDDGRSRELLSGPEGEQYTLPFEAKSNIDGAEIRAFHRQGNAAENQITFGTVILGKHDEWAKYVLRGTLTGVEAKAQGLYFDLRYSNPPDTEIYIRNVKIEKGSFATEWSASPND